VKPNALIELARNASLRVYQPQQEVCRMGAPAVELQILIDGEAMVLPSNTVILPRQTIGELEVLTHSYYVATVIATGERTQTLAIKAKDFEAALSQNPLLAMNVLEIMSMRLQESLGQAAAMTQI
jgi:CRP-like cAMP-binding protein